MKQELRHHYLPLALVFIITSLFWLFSQTPWYEFIFLLLGLTIGAFFLDLDHIIYWLYLKPNLEESRLAQIALDKKDYRSVLKLLESTHKNHTNLIFHHYFFQTVLALISLFVFTSSSSIFAKSFLTALNLHLLVDEFVDFKNNPKHLQEWLFAREPKQLSLESLKYYLGFFSFLALIFILLLINSHA